MTLFMDNPLHLMFFFTDGDLCILVRTNFSCPPYPGLWTTVRQKIGQKSENNLQGMALYKLAPLTLAYQTRRFIVMTSQLYFVVYFEQPTGASQAFH